MTYRQILDKYKKNALPEEKQKEVAADIEKYEAISDYLYEESEIPDINEAFSEPNENVTDPDVIPVLPAALQTARSELRILLQ